MFDQQEISLESNAIARVVHLFPKADEYVVGALTAHGEALKRYLAQAHHLTRSEVTELLEVFILPFLDNANGSSTA